MKELPAKTRKPNQVVRLRPAGVAREEVGRISRFCNLFPAAFLAIFLSGLPAVALTWMWLSLNIGKVLGFEQVSFWYVFLLVYIAGLGCVAPTCVFLALANWVNLRLDQWVTGELELSEKGMRWVLPCAELSWMLAIMQAPVRVVLWDSVVAVSLGPPDKELLALHKDILPPSEGVYLPSALYILSRQGPGKTLRRNRIQPENFTAQDRARILEAICRWAPQAYITPATETALIGESVPDHYPAYTDIWLSLLGTSTERARTEPLSAGDTLGDGAYKVIQRKQTGGQANVYIATACGAQQEEVIVKEFILSTQSDAARRASLTAFESECAMLSRLNHSSIVRLVDAFFEDNRAYTVLGQVEGDSLKQVVDRDGPLDTSTAVSWGSQMCGLLAYLHRQSPPVVHRDFTPDNIILTGDGRLVLIDFSIARLADGSATAEVAGKHSYISPEQFRGEVSPSTDIYSLGATLFFLLTGHHPEPISQSHPRYENARTSEDLDSIVARCTAIEATARYKTVEEIGEDLSRLRLSEQDAAPVSGSSPPFRFVVDGEDPP